MRSLVVPLGYSLVFLLNQIHLAAAACTNTTGFIHESLETIECTGGGPNIMSKLDFISCPSSSNVSCELPPKFYTITITPTLNITAATNSFDDRDWRA
jgi:hypothetical protein